jgi:hypothetical protein
MDNEPNEEAEIFKSVIRALRANAREDADTIHNLREEICMLQIQMDNLTASSIHTCHDQCQRPMCVLRRECDKWEETARLYCKNSEFNREIREKVERERDNARHKLDLCMAANSDVARIAKERDDARGHIAELRYIADTAIEYIGHTAVQQKLRDKFNQLKELRNE